MVHLTADGAAVRAGCDVGREQVRFGLDLVEVFGNGQGVPHLHAVV